MDDAPGRDVVEHVARWPFAETLQRLVDAITHAGLTVFTRIDHAENARAAGLAMPPSTVLIYGSPVGGTPLMLHAPQLALDLPLRVLVRRREDGKVVISFHDAAAMLRAAGLPNTLVGRLEPAQQLLVNAVAP